MKRAMLSVVLAAAVMVIGMAAQAPPNLSGTWRPQNPNSGQVNPFEFTITQTADSVTIRTPLSTPESVTMKTNGEETRTQVGGGQGGAGAATVTSRATWEGSKLVVMSAIAGGRGGPGSARAAYSLTGDTLTLETSNSQPDGSMTQVRTVTYAKYTPVPMPAPPARTVESGYVSLFNGKDLTGWHISKTNHHGTTPDFHVMHGMIVATQNPLGGGGILLTDKKYKNVEVYLEVKPDWGCDSGLFLRSNEAGDA